MTAKTTQQFRGMAKRLAQLSAIRKEAAAQEAAVKSDLLKFMTDNEIGADEFEARIDGATVKIAAELKTKSMTILDVNKLREKCDPETFMAMASVTLTAAKQHCAQQLLNQCCTTEESAPYLDIRAKGIPAPEIKVAR